VDFAGLTTVSFDRITDGRVLEMGVVQIVWTQKCRQNDTISMKITTRAEYKGLISSNPDR